MRVRKPLALVLLLVVVVGGAIFVATKVLGPPSLTPAQVAARAAAARARRLEATQRKDAHQALGLVAATLPTTPGALEPVAPDTLFRTPLPAHQVVGFVPYWTLPQVTSADFTNSTVLSYYGVSVSGNGSLLMTGPEWGNAAATLASSAFRSFVVDAHAAQTRVLLTLASADDAAIAGLVRDPAATSARVATALSALVKQHGLDGVDIDIEGDKQADRAGFVRFVGDLATALRAADPGGELLLDTYAGSAGNPKDFFDVKRLARYVDEIFVEGYDMNTPQRASATAPLVTTNLGYSETQTLMQYEAVVSPQKLILGMPFYGYDFTTITQVPGARLTAAARVAVTFSAVTGVGRTAYWDPVAESPYTRFSLDGKSHETYYDDPTSIALKTALASQFHLLGVGAWAFGMEGADPAMLAALSGDSPVVKLPGA